MRSTNYPDFPDTEEGDVAADEFYNSRTASGDCRNAYECLQGVDRLLKARGLELLMYEGGSDHVFEIVERAEQQDAPKPKRFRGPDIVEVLADAGVDPALAAIIDPQPDPLDVEDERAARKLAADMLKPMLPTPDENVMGVGALDCDEVVGLLADPSTNDAERKALIARRDVLLQDALTSLRGAVLKGEARAAALAQVDALMAAV